MRPPDPVPVRIQRRRSPRPRPGLLGAASAPRNRSASTGPGSWRASSTTARRSTGPSRPASKNWRLARMARRSTGTSCGSPSRSCSYEPTLVAGHRHERGHRDRQALQRRGVGRVRQRRPRRRRAGGWPGRPPAAADKVPPVKEG
ncbi:MAG: hypothetical protein M0C28_01860 [Candidatus Moduliflexus flocculans]|nr:hypothetical protein [Candidatus Moduliflexus flocculans]